MRPLCQFASGCCRPLPARARLRWQACAQTGRRLDPAPQAGRRRRGDQDQSPGAHLKCKPEVDTTAPQILEQSVEVAQIIPRERTQKRNGSSSWRSRCLRSCRKSRTLCKADDRSTSIIARRNRLWTSQGHNLSRKSGSCAVTGASAESYEAPHSGHSCASDQQGEDEGEEKIQRTIRRKTLWLVTSKSIGSPNGESLPQSGGGLSRRRGASRLRQKTKCDGVLPLRREKENERNDAGSVQGRNARHNAGLWFSSYNQPSLEVEGNSRGPRTLTQDGHHREGGAALGLQKNDCPTMSGIWRRGRD